MMIIGYFLIFLLKNIQTDLYYYESVQFQGKQLCCFCFPSQCWSTHWCRTLDKREYLVIIRNNFLLILHKTYVVTPPLNCLDKMVQMRGHNTCF